MSHHQLIINDFQYLEIAASALQSIAQIEGVHILNEENVDHLNRAVSVVLSSITDAPAKEGQGSETLPKQENLIQEIKMQELNSDLALRQKCMELSTICTDSNVGLNEDVTIKFANKMYNYILSIENADNNKQLRLKSMEMAVHCRSSPYGYRDDATIRFANDIYNYISSGRISNVINS